MRRREFITLIGSAAALPLIRLPIASAQEPGHIYRLAIMTGAARAVPRMVAFFDELKVFGFVEGQNLKIVIDGFDLRDDQFAEVATTLIKAAPDAVFCVSDVADRRGGLAVKSGLNAVQRLIQCAQNPDPATTQ